MDFTNSNSMKERAKIVSPHLTQTFSRSATSFVEGAYPVYVKSADGSHFIDVDNNKFLDYLLGLGPITLGYNYPRVNDAIIEQIKDGILFSLPHVVELDLSELVCDTIPNADMVKFEKSGSNAVTGALRASRYISKLDKVAYCGSGGVWHDWYAAAISRNGGVPKFNESLINVFDYNDSDGLEQIFEDNPSEVGTIILEPTVYEKPTGTFLQKVRKIADSNNAILILDEVVTGFRFALGGGQEFFDIKGDFVCFGKGMGNGLPISAITGPEEFMKTFDKLWVSSTNSSETLSMAGTIATINEMKEKQTIDHCWNVGKILFENWNKITKKLNIDCQMIGYPIRMTMKCNDSKGNESINLKSLILQELIKRGIFMSPSPSFISYSHSETDIQKTLTALEEVCQFIISNITNDNFNKYLEGNIPKPIFTNLIKSTKKKIDKN